MSIPQSPHRPRRKKEPDKKVPISPFLRLIAAVLLFALCFVAKTRFPQQTQRQRAQLAALIGTQTDFQETFSRLGEKLERQDKVVSALGDFCVSVFAPEGVTVPGREESAQAEETSVPPEPDQSAQGSG